MTVAFSWEWGRWGGGRYGSARVPNFNEEASHCIKPPPQIRLTRVFLFLMAQHINSTHIKLSMKLAQILMILDFTEKTNVNN
jgi:hypothetical protein